MELWSVLLSGTVGAALVKLLDNVVQWLLQRKTSKDAAKTKSKSELEVKVDKLEGATMALLLDAIQHRCEKYITQGYVDMDDLRRLHIMHQKYHDEGGNGDLDKLMGRVDSLPMFPPRKEA